MDNILVPKGSN